MKILVLKVILPILIQELKITSEINEKISHYLQSKVWQDKVLRYQLFTNETEVFNVT